MVWRGEASPSRDGEGKVELSETITRDGRAFLSKHTHHTVPYQPSFEKWERESHKGTTRSHLAAGTIEI